MQDIILEDKCLYHVIRGEGIMTTKRVRKRQISLTLDETLIKEMEKIREETGVPISQQVELALKGYRITKKEE